MPHYTDEQIESANRVDLAGFLLSRGESITKRGSQYLWEKNNVWVSGNQWFSHYEVTGGLAVGFVMKYFDKTFQEAVAELYDLTHSAPIIVDAPEKKKERKELVIPPRNDGFFHVLSYLTKQRCVSRDVVAEFVRKGLLYEDAQYHNCIFVGKDNEGKVKHIHRRSTFKNFKQTAEGSIAEHSFHYNGSDEWIFAFEAPIDMLAFITLHPANWKDHSYVALCSVSERALLQRLKDNTNLKKIVLCLDHDKYGIQAEERIAGILREKGYDDIYYIRPEYKDWDEDLKAMCGMEAIPSSEIETNAVQQEVPVWDQSQL